MCFAVLAAVASALAAGELDPTFSSDGKFTEPLGEGARPGASFSALALQPDGKIVATGTASNSVSVVARINPGGTLDSTFDSDGKLLHAFGAGANEALFPRAIAVAPDGKIVMAGTQGNFNTQVNRAVVVRLTPEGAFDNSLDGDGVLIEQLGETGNPDTSIAGVSVLPDGRILLAGGATDSAGRTAVLLARRNVDGSPDGSFGTGGKRLVQLGTGANASSSASAMELQPDGKIVIAGPATDTDAVQPDASVIARFDADGQALDSSFGTGGKYLGRFDTPNHQTSAVGLALQADGKPVVVGNAHEIVGTSPPSQAMVARLNVNGQGVDSGFATNGVFMQTFEGGAGDAALSGVAVQPDGKIVAVGNGEDQGFTILILRLTSVGALDPSFSGDGRDLTQLGGLSSAFAAVELQPDGKILAAGNTLNNVNGNLDTHSLLARYIADLPPTASFTAAPNPSQTGQAVTFDGGGSADPEGLIASYDWDFGDGSTATGVTTSHTYATAGTYQANLTVRDGYGLIASSTQTVIVNPSDGNGGNGTGSDTTAPVFEAARLTNRVFRVNPNGAPAANTSAKAPRGTKFVYRLSEAATVTFRIKQRKPGRRVNGRCRKPTRRNRDRPRCVRLVGRGSFTQEGRRGRNRKKFSGKIGQRTLRPGRYRAILRAVDDAGNKSARKRLKFRIVRR